MDTHDPEFVDEPEFRPWDGRPRVDRISKATKEGGRKSVVVGDQLLFKLIEIHGEPRHDLITFKEK